MPSFKFKLSIWSDVSLNDFLYFSLKTSLSTLFSDLNVVLPMRVGESGELNSIFASRDAYDVLSLLGAASGTGSDCWRFPPDRRQYHHE